MAPNATLYAKMIGVFQENSHFIRRKLSKIFENNVRNIGPRQKAHFDRSFDLPKNS
jgi:hypothetical protein